MRIKTDKLTMLTVTYVAVCFVLSGVSGTALQSITYAMIPDRPIDVIYAGAPAINLYNRSTLTIVECAGICEGDAACGGFNYCEISGDTTCETLEASTDPIDPTILWWRAGCFYYYKQDVCLNGGVMGPNGTCACACGYTNTYCEDYVQDCGAAYQLGHRKKHIMTIQPNRNFEGFKVECRLLEGPVTRILTREQNQTDHFENVTWGHFKIGIWYPWRNNAWIGLDKLHSILINSPYNHTAKVTVIFQNDSTEYTGYYGNFFVDSEQNSYTLTYTNFWAGEYPLEDGLSGLAPNNSANGQPFCPLSSSDTCGGCSTNTGKCWWFGSACGSVNLFSVLGELVWLNNSVIVPVFKLSVDIIAVLP